MIDEKEYVRRAINLAVFCGYSGICVSASGNKVFATNEGSRIALRNLRAELRFSEKTYSVQK